MQGCIIGEPLGCITEEPLAEVPQGCITEEPWGATLNPCRAFTSECVIAQWYITHYCVSVHQMGPLIY